MCGIAAYTGSRPAATHVLHALERLEYRGYDSAGVAAHTADGQVTCMRTVHGVASLAVARDESRRDASDAAIGHTRWATHGAVSTRNAHPLSDCSGDLFIAHNGIVDNADELRTEAIAAGHRFTTDVDSEVIAHLLEAERRAGEPLALALGRATARLRGTWAVVALHGATGELAATALHSPLVLARTAHGAFLASDIGALSDEVDDYQVLDDGDLVEANTVRVRWHRRARALAEPPVLAVPWTSRLAAVGTHPDHMGNEIDEQPAVATRVLDALADHVADGSLWRDLGLASMDRVQRVAVIGCGTSLHAGRAIGAVFARLGGVPVQALVASEAEQTALEPRTLVIAISQSGETADILHALDVLPAPERTVLALTNNPVSSLARRADAVIDCLAGPEIGVAATKTFAAQVLTGACVALSGLAGGGRISRTALGSGMDALLRTPALLAEALQAWEGTIPALTREFETATGFLFLGRGTGVVYAAEGALKLKELTYRWAEHQPAGELKHGPLALVDAGTPVFVVDSAEPRLEANIAEVAARGGRVVRVRGAAPSTHHDRAAEEPPPWGPLEAVVPLQLFSRALALHLGRDVDKPRNLAKSVTVH